MTIHHRKEGDGVDVTPPAYGKLSMLHLLAYSVKALHVETEMHSGSGCVLHDVPLFSLKMF